MDSSVFEVVKLLDQSFSLKAIEVTKQVLASDLQPLEDLNELDRWDVNQDDELENHSPVLVPEANDQSESVVVTVPENTVSMSCKSL